MAASARVLTESPELPAVDPGCADLRSSHRLRAVDDTCLLTAPPPLALRLLCELANSRLGTDVSLVTLVTDNEQFFAGSNGLCEPWHSRRGTPLTHSFCQIVVVRREPLVIHDAREHSLVQENRAIAELGVVGYLGVPLCTSDGTVLGSICTITSNPRQWTEDDLGSLRSLATSAMEEIVEHSRQTKERRQLEADLEQARKMEAIGTLASAIAHDFNNLLMVFQTYAELIRMDPGEHESVTRHANALLDTTERANQVVQRLVDWTRMDSLKKEPINLTQAIRDSIPLIRALIPTSIALEVLIPPQDYYIEAPPESVTQILLNLASNAEYAMRQHGGTLTVELNTLLGEEELRGANSGLLLRITDTGRGIPEGQLHRVSTPFFTTKEGNHKGMGLSAVYGIVDSIGGRMELQSTEERGTTVIIELPRLQKKPSQPGVSRPVEAASSSTRILFVDDEPAIIRAVSIHLERLGYKVTCQTSSHDALTLFAANPSQFDVILTDQTMPGLTGTEFLRAVRKLRPDFPAVILTGYINKQESLPAGVPCVGKPVSIDRLSAAIDEVLRSSAH